MDLFSFDSTRSGIVEAMATGGRYRWSDHVLVGAVAEVRIRSREDITQLRLPLNAIYQL